MKKVNYFLAALLGLSIQFAEAQVKKGSVLIKNATVLTVTNGTLENSDVLVQDGIIKKVGQNISAPNGVTTIDATGKFVMPGIIDAHSHLGLDVVNESSAPIVAEVRMKDVVNPYEVGLYRALAGGVTISHAMHGSANVIGGQNATLKHRYGSTDPADIIMQDAPRTIKFALGENPTRVHGRGNNIQPRTRMGVEAIIRNGFNEAIQYQKAWDTYNAASSKKGSTAMPPVHNERLQILSDILNDKIIIHCHSYRADEIYMLINVARDFGITKLVFQHTNEGFKVAPEIAEYTMGASVFADWWSYKFEVYYSTAYNAAILTENGALTSINSDDAELIRHLYHEAAKTQRYGGMTDEQALAMITINPAKQLGIADKVGSIEEGKDGDLVIFDGHPLSSYTVPQMTFVDGVKYFDIKEDADDQRIKVSPTQMVEPIMLYGGHESNCMQDTEHLFETTNSLFHTNY
ncbi:imidazolonepropionase-like amidohydrolase [Algoriphagus ratkowskyi]|uniref:Amidohydrolase family protein n=1 Tax=Algoriphagus ratkowskyi TaxID=57028 RepID=A0A2W7RCI6_9BACT|nr:amidohydrolase family protein [Algoriphagus ratkowskyi]PZX56836.1 imidazolonepropionase-like amidohydrolase [Algoriphagus ratkowskyi]TXD79752.1 amidohydrolase family protein [Algoriphagus ratkowskyi]